MKKIFFYLTILSIIVINGCDDEQKKSNNNPSAPELTSPANKEIDVKTDATLNWKASSDKDGDVVKYNVYFGTKNPPVDKVSSLQSGTTFVPTLSEGTIYYWKISADDGKGGVTESSVWSFTTFTTPIPTNHNPSIPVLTSPADQTTNLPLNATLEWEASTDADGDAVKYDVWFSTDLPPDDVVSPLQTSTSYAPTLLQSTTYYWKIIANDGKGGTSESETRSFQTTTGGSSNPPSVPNLLLPLTGSTNIPLNEVINWNKSTDPDGDDVRYDVYFGTANPPTIAKSLQPDTFFTPTLTSNTTYYWKIIAKDDKGTNSESEIRSFTTYDQNSTTLNLFSPPKSSTKIKLNELLRWNEWKSTSGGTVKYNVYFGTANPPTTQVSTDQLTTTYTPSLTAGNTYYWKVIVNDGNGNTAESEVWSFSTISNPPPKPTLTSPTNSSTDIPLTQILNWDAIVDGNKTIKYNVFFGTASPPSKLVSNLQSANSFTPTLSGNKTYYWKIVADNGEGGQSESDIWSFKTINNAPAKPSLITPTDAATDVNITEALKWTSSIDPDGDIVKYNVFFGTTEAPTTKVASSLSSTSYNPSLVGSTKYYWKVSADDGSGGITESDVRSFTTKAVASSVPILTAPDNNAVNISLNPTLTWNASTISGGGAVKYDVYFGNVKSPPIVSTSQDGTSYVPTNVVANTTYYWKVVANGEFASEVRSFTTIKPPTVPAISSPAKGATDVSVNTELVWNPSTSAAGYTVTYNVFLDTFPTPVTKVSSSQSGTKYSATKLFSGNTYYWKIVADDGHGGITESEVRSFKTIIIKPSVSVLVSPANDNTNTIPISVTLNWRSSTTTSGKKARYDIFLGTAGNTPKVRSLQPDTFYTVTLLSNTVYSWKVASDDGKGGVTESNVFTFKTALTPPKLPFAISPVNSATGVALDSKISWYSSTSYSGKSAKYNVFFGTATTPSNKVGDMIPDTFYLPTSSLFSNTSYYWKLSIDDGSGGVTNSDVYTFKTVIVPPTKPTLTAPANNATNVNLSATLTWSTSTGYSGNAVKYNVYYGLDNPPATKAGSMITTTSFSPTLVANSTFYWKVVADDGNGGQTASDVFSFKTVTDPPSAPLLISPANSVSDLDLTSTILKWRKSISKAGSVVKYNVFLDTLSPPVFNASKDLTDTVFTPTLLTSNTVYYWKIEAVDANGGASVSETFSFTTKIVPPSVPTLNTPVNNATDVLVTTKLEWGSSTTSSGKTAKYTVFLDAGSTPIDPITKVSELQAGTSFTPSLLSNTKYFWKVVADDGKGGKSESGVGTFTIKVTPPEVPILKAPINSATEVSTSATLSWNASNSYAGLPTKYNVYFGSDIQNLVLVSSKQEGTTYTPTLSRDNTYYWKVEADDGKGGVSTSVNFTFKTVTTPTQPTLIYPANNDVNVPLTVTFNWSASTNSAFQNISPEYFIKLEYNRITKVYPPLGLSLKTTSYKLSNLLSNTVYKWSVYVSFNEVFEWNDYNTFTTAIVPPTVPTLKVPAKNATEIPLTANLEWSASTGYSGKAVKYNVYFGTDNPPVTKVSTLQDGTTFTPTLNSRNTYYWKIEADDQNGGITASEVFSFSTILPPVSEPLLSSPANNVIFTSLNKQLSWGASVSSAGKSIGYNVYFGTDNPPPKVSNQQTNTYYDVTLTANTKYYWKIEAVDSDGQTNESEIRTFSVVVIDVVSVSGGTFTMGCTSEQGNICKYNDEIPTHSVTLSSFKIAKYEVTQALWVTVMGSNPSNNNTCSDCPVENVSWDDAQDFITKLNTGTGSSYRLPTEAEWEFVARGGNSSKGYKYAGGTTNYLELGWYSDNSEGSSKSVGGKTANELGLYDMSGNVSEWCSDWYDGTYYSSSPSSNPKGPDTGYYRVRRGGSYKESVLIARVSARYPHYNSKYIDTGFRLALP